MQIIGKPQESFHGSDNMDSEVNTPTNLSGKYEGQNTSSKAFIAVN